MPGPLNSINVPLKDKKKKIINLHHAQFWEQQFLAVGKPCYVKGLQSCAPHKHFRWVQCREQCCMCRNKVFPGLCSFYCSARMNQIAHEWLAAKKGEEGEEGEEGEGGEGRGREGNGGDGKKWVKRKGISFPPSLPPNPSLRINSYWHSSLESFSESEQ